MKMIKTIVTTILVVASLNVLAAPRPIRSLGDIDRIKQKRDRVEQQVGKIDQQADMEDLSGQGVQFINMKIVRLTDLLIRSKERITLMRDYFIAGDFQRVAAMQAFLCFYSNGLDINFEALAAYDEFHLAAHQSLLLEIQLGQEMVVEFGDTLQCN